MLNYSTFYSIVTTEFDFEFMFQVALSKKGRKKPMTREEIFT